MGRRSSRQPKGDGQDSDEVLKRALRLRSAQQITDLREPELRATGTELIAQRLADARQARDAAAEIVDGEARR